MATKSISQLDTQATANETDLFEVAIVDANSASGYASKKESAAAIADAIVGEYQYPLRLTETTSKTISGAINEIAGEVADLKDLDGSASGDIATFVDGSDNPLKELEISIEAVQSGSGDPSPTNVRPISGWTGANIYVSGEDTSNPTTYNIDWQSTAGTVYGGTLNPLTGVLAVTHEVVDLGDLNWALLNGKFHAFLGEHKQYTSTVVPDILCSVYKPLSVANVVNMVAVGITLGNSSFWGARDIGVYDPSYVDAETFKTAVTGQTLVYPLATPVTYQLTPTEIRSLLGLNNVWADCGAITELKYTRDLNLCINDIIARIEALEGASNTRSLSLSPTLTKSLTSDSDTAEGKTEETEEETKEKAQNER